MNLGNMSQQNLTTISTIYDGERISLVVFLLATMLFSTILNSSSLYGIYKIKKKISADHIKAHIFAINLIFTHVAIPYYLVKETNLLTSVLACKLLYSLTDFIMFNYNNLLILMAFDRFFIICTQLRYRVTQLMFYFYSLSFLISLLSLARLFTNNCEIIGLNNLKYLFNGRFDELVQTGDHVVVIYNLIILAVISINWSATFILYSIIVKYVYQNSLDETMYAWQQRGNNSIWKRVFSNEKKTENQVDRDDLNSEKKTLSGAGTQSQDATSSEMTSQEKRQARRFYSRSGVKKSKHWRITKIFIKILIIFTLMRIPWSLSNFAVIPYHPLIYYSFCLEVVITPLIHFTNNMPCRMVNFHREKSIKFRIKLTMEN